MKTPLHMTVVALVGSISLSCAGPETVPREWKSKDGTVVPYRLRTPSEVVPDKTYPLVLFLHGAGERGSDNSAQLKHGVTSIIEGADTLKDPIFLLAPQCPKDRYWSPIDLQTGRLSEPSKSNALLDAIIALVDDTVKSQPIDPKRIYLTGISMGGYATWDLLARHPKKFAAAIPICGGGDPDQAAKFASVPIWAFHGEADPVVPVKTTREMIAALEKAGGKPKVTYYPGVGHNSWTTTYDNPGVIRWLLAQHQSE
jgi:predicted peptidase